MRLSYFILILFLAAAACSTPGKNLGANGWTDDFGQAGFDAAIGAESDPTSIAFFQKSVGDRVYFNVDEFTLNKDSKAALDIQAQWLTENPTYLAVIEGHADEQGTREYNLALGFRRARSVQEYLVAKGVSLLRLKTLSFGKERPAEICSSERCYSKNRRVVSILNAGTM